MVYVTIVDCLSILDLGSRRGQTMDLDVKEFGGMLVQNIVSALGVFLMLGQSQLQFLRKGKRAQKDDYL